ncbi:MAG: LPS export ABC transporter periplasmic protein LptC [Aureispira sp.]|nr:LPS export ABC transporter periplasmic protein LptC [Aureispira sp.]
MHRLLYSSTISNFFSQNYPKLVIGCLFFTILSCGGSDVKNLDTLETSVDIPGVERGVDVEILYSDSAIVRVSIKAPIMLNHRSKENPRREFPNGIDVDVFDENKQQTSKLISKHAEQSSAKRIIYLQDSVVFWNTKNEKLETDELIWNENEERIYSTKAVRVTTPSQIINGRGFRSNLDFTLWEIDSVSGIINSSNLTDGPI